MRTKHGTKFLADKTRLVCLCRCETVECHELTVEADNLAAKESRRQCKFVEERAKCIEHLFIVESK